MAAGFAVPYAVSAWTVSYSFNIMWLDALYLLPLLLMAGESLLRRGRLFPLAAVAGAAALINYYMFGIMVPFLVCYLAIRYAGGDDVVRRTGAGRFTIKAGAALGVGVAIAGVLLLPTYHGLANGRTNILGQDPIPVPLPWSTQAARLFGGTFDWFQGSPNLAAGGGPDRGLAVPVPAPNTAPRARGLPGPGRAADGRLPEPGRLPALP